MTLGNFIDDVLNITLKELIVIFILTVLIYKAIDVIGVM